MSPQEIVTLLGGNAVLLKVPRGTKKAVTDEWQRLTAADMTPDYFAGLNGGCNIGVSLGKPSGLITIDWDIDELAKEFARLNPALRKTLISRANRGCNYWIRIKGEYPPSCKTKTLAGEKVGEWRADGNQTVISGVHETGKEYKHKGGPPLEVAFADIRWPESCIVPGTAREHAPTDDDGINDAALVARCGPAFTSSPDGTITVNQSYYVQRFCIEHDVLFEQEEGRFFLYGDDHGAWLRVVPDVIKEMMRREWERLTAPFGLAKLTLKLTDDLLNSLVRGIRSHSGCVGVFKPLANMIHCKNGMLRINDDLSLDLLPFSPDYYSRNPIPIAWNPDAVSPMFDAIMASMQPYDSSLFLRYVGNIFIGGNKSQCILILAGDSGTSKSTLCEMVEIVVGLGNVAELRTDHLNNRFEIGRYKGKILLSGKDVSGDFLMKEGAKSIKKLTGHDHQSGESKGVMDMHDIYGCFPALITCNERLLLKLEGDSDISAWRRRLLLITMEEASRHERTISDYAQKLISQEGEGILVQIVDAACAHLAELTEHGTFVRSPQQQARVDALLAESRSLSMFLEDCVVRDNGGDVTSDDLTAAYNDYCESRGWNPIELRKVHLALPDHMMRMFASSHGTNIKRDGSNKRGYRNVSLVLPEQEGDQPA